MSHGNADQHLSEIATLWTEVCQAHQGPTDQAREAQERLLARYGGAIRRYLHGALRDAEAVDELAQEFALRFLSGGLRGANPHRGRFRDFLKGVLFHLIADHRYRRRRTPVALGDDAPEPAAEESSTYDMDREFLRSWREELLAAAWKGLAQAEKLTGQPYYQVLCYRRDHPEARSAEMAERLAEQLGKPLTAAAVRQTLHRARERFGDLLLDEVVQSLDNPETALLEQELVDLNLYEYCKPALERRRAEMR